MHHHLAALFLVLFPASALAQSGSNHDLANLQLHPPTGSPVFVSSSPGLVQALYTNLAASPTSLVPGLGTARFTASTSSSGPFPFDRPWLSNSGAHWILNADTDLATTTDDILLLDGVVVAQEGTQAPWGAAGENYGPFDVRIGINDAGEYCFPNNTSATVNDDYIVKVTAGPTHTVLAQEAGAIGVMPAQTYDDTIDSVVLLNDGRVAFQADLIDGGGIPTTQDEIVVFDTTLVAQEGVTIPTGLAGGASDTWENFDFEDIWVDPSGATVLMKGDTLGATTGDQIVTVNNAVQLQEGQIIPGSGFAAPIAATGIDEISMDKAGNWYARGNNTDSSDWVVRNGAVIARTDDPIGDSGGRIAFRATLDGFQTVPPSGSAVTGQAWLLMDTAANTITYRVTFTGALSGGETAANIHGFAGPGGTAAPLYSLPLGATKDGVITYLESEETPFLSDFGYIEIASAGFPGGEIRGQMLQTPETWDDAQYADCFFLHVGNGVGDWVVGGVTSGPALANGVLVLNGQYVIAREGDPIDVDGNGLFDDDTFYNTFGNDDAALLDDGTFYFVATTKNAALTQYGQGFFRRLPGDLKASFCYGDGSTSTPCPCGNSSLASQREGCINSIGFGAKLDASGHANVGNDTLVLLATKELPSATTIFLQGNALVAGGSAVFGDGVRCAGGTLKRLYVKAASGGAVSAPAVGDPSISARSAALGDAFASGAERFYQAYYRDPNPGWCANPPGNTWNVTNGVRAIW